MEQKELEDLCQKYEKLYHKVVKKCGVYQNNQEYEEYVQLARIAFFEVAREFIAPKTFEEAYPIGYLFQKIVWKLKEHQRKIWRQQEILVAVNEEQGRQLISGLSTRASVSSHEYADQRLTLCFLWHKLSAKEKCFLAYRLEKARSSHYLAPASRQTIANWRKKLKKRWQDEKID
ncbi:hypothetical protein [Candidatus Enterococcus courvalinii]|uniref:RNA polymerase sigma-70 region 2 domain-containing protein n=1 Tax=Candidatus Enterococcus courvalinii TaxID=2815329 RepID=A0ABS3HZF3_9ENTE|nr:hypothetical protein [Enterococcus sp. MSG2901]MBO0481455.1 hypothetical protein [Enterococcus sp. MSG2901]